jgi:hypothetical protein
MICSTRTPSSGEPGERPLHEDGRGSLTLVWQDLGVGEPRGVIDRDMSELPAGAAHTIAPVAGDPVPDALDSAEVGIEMHELAWRLALIAPRRLARLQLAKQGKAEPLEMLGHCGRASVSVQPHSHSARSTPNRLHHHAPIP